MWFTVPMREKKIEQIWESLARKTYTREDWYSWKKRLTGNSIRPVAFRLGSFERFEICLLQRPVLRQNTRIRYKKTIEAKNSAFEMGSMWKTYSDDFPIRSIDECVFAIHVVVVRKVAFFDLTDDGDQKHTARRRTFTTRHYKIFFLSFNCTRDFQQTCDSKTTNFKIGILKIWKKVILNYTQCSVGQRAGDNKFLIRWYHDYHLSVIMFLRCGQLNNHLTDLRRRLIFFPRNSNVERVHYDIIFS